MSQKTILSFFKAKDVGKPKEVKSKSVVINDSPVKITKNKRKVQCLESDDESSDLKKKDLNGHSNGDLNVSENATEKSSDQSCEKENGETNKVEKEEIVSSGKPSKMMKTENGDEKKSCTSPKKETADSSKQIESVQPSTSSDIRYDEASGSSNQNGFVDFIPKRKTARKQITYSKDKRSYSKPATDEVKSENPEIKTSEESVPVDIVVKMEETENLQEQPEKEAASSVTVHIKEESKDLKETSNEKQKVAAAENLEETEDIEEQPEKEAPSRVTVHIKESKGQKKSSDKRRKVAVAENLEEQPEEEAPSRVTVQDKKDSKDKKSKDLKKPEKKRKVAVTPKSKASPVKKSATKESIQSFFAPVKKTEEGDVNNMDVDEDDDTSKRNQEEHEDSPVKKNSRRKTKVQCLESDDEDCEENPDVNGEVNDSELNTSSASVDKNEDAVETTPENSAVEEKTSPPVKEEVKSENDESSKEAENKIESTVKEADKNPKDDAGKQKLSIKSTSAETIIYDPSKNHYHPIEDACWKQGEKVPYLALAKTLELIENTSGRLKIIEILSNFLRSVMVLSPDDMLQCVYLCLNRLAPEYAGIELGVGDMLLMKAVAQATGRTVEKIKSEVAVKGDLGLVSETSRGNQRVMFAPPKLTVSSVFQKFLEIAKMTGNASMAKKIGIIKGLFVACRDCEAKYIIRSLSGKLRIGLAEQSVLSAIARAAVLTPPGQTYPPEIVDTSRGISSEKFKEKLDAQVLILKTAYCECPNYDLIIPVLLKEGISVLPERCQLAPGVPLKPMLAHPTDGIDKVLERFDKNAFTCEFKYDGERAQIHKMENGDVKIFSRNQEDNTSKYPDIISRLSNAVKDTTKTFVLDSEAVAWDKGTKQILPFQVLSTRKKKDAVESEIVVQVCIMAFDLLYLNGESLVKKSLKERRSLLHSSFKEVENEFMFAQYRDGNSAETMQEFLDESVKGNCEGLMVKALETDASYEIAKRSHNWLKLKKDYLQGIGDTLDLVVIGGYYGKGKRTGNYGGFLLACYDEENEEFQSICKLGTGFKDDILEAHTKFLKGHVIGEPKSYFRYDHSLQPDEWFEPVQVWEIKCADLSISPVHKAAVGIVDPEKGISLRFPRFIRIRDDKTPEIATNSAQIAEMYQRQQQIQNTSNKNAKVDEDYY